MEVVFLGQNSYMNISEKAVQFRKYSPFPFASVRSTLFEKRAALSALKKDNAQWIRACSLEKRSPQIAKYILHELRKALPFSQSLSKSAGVAGLIFIWLGACISENAGVPEFLLKLNSSSMAGSSSIGTSNLFIIALRANSIASVFIQLTVNSSSMAWSLLSESISGCIRVWRKVLEIMRGEEGKLGAVCMEEVVASEALSSIP